MIIYAIVCCLQVQGNNNTCLYVKLYVYMFNCISFCSFSCYIGDRAEFNKYTFILALYIFICLLKCEIMQYILKYNVILFLFFHTILTVAQNTQMAHLAFIPECYSVYLVIFPICISLEVFWEHSWCQYPKCPSNRGFHIEDFVLL